MKLQPVIEGLLFLSGDEGITLSQLAGCLEEEQPEKIEDIMDEISKKYAQDEFGIELIRFGNHYKFVTKESIYPYAQRLFSNVKSASLSSAAMETLAIIAYKQPITRAEIEEIRGVGCDMMLKKLTARGLIEEAGRMDIPGRPILYQVTDIFMDSFSAGKSAGASAAAKNGNELRRRTVRRTVADIAKWRLFRIQSFL